MRKKIICILISGIFLLTIFSSVNTSTKANLMSGLFETKNTLSKNKEELTSTVLWLYIASGDFYVENNTLNGFAKFILSIEFWPLPAISLQKNSNIKEVPLNDPNFLLFLHTKHLIFIIVHI